MSKNVEQEKKELQSALAASRVPQYVWGTSLGIEKQGALRDYIQHEKFVRRQQPKSIYNGIFVYPTRPADQIVARKAFHLAAKEMVISGVSLQCVTLSALSRHLIDREDDNLSDDADMYFVSDFYERGAALPMDGRDSGIVRSWIRRNIENGVGVSLLSDESLTGQGIASWWPQSFLGQLIDMTVSFGIAKP